MTSDDIKQIRRYHAVLSGQKGVFEQEAKERGFAFHELVSVLEKELVNLENDFPELAPPFQLGDYLSDPTDGIPIYSTSALLAHIETVLAILKNEIDTADRNTLTNVPRPAEIQEGYVFIAMPMDPSYPELEDVLDAIKEAASRCGFQAERIDEPQSNERITDRILESIRRAEYVIVDLTHSKQNVYYEAGYAQGLDKTPIYIARDGTKLEFDLKDYPVLFFRNMKHLRGLLEKRLRGLAVHQGRSVQ